MNLKKITTICIGMLTIFSISAMLCVEHSEQTKKELANLVVQKDIQLAQKDSIINEKCTQIEELSHILWRENGLDND